MKRLLSKLDDLLLVAVLAGGGWLGYQHVTDEPQRPPAAVVDEGPSVELAALDRLPVKGRAPKTGYDRKLFGVGSVDLDRNGCDVRNDTLRRDLDEVVLVPGTQECKVAGGRLEDPYTGDLLTYAPGDRQIEVDHVVALSDAWQKGAQQLSPEQRIRLGNDPRNLLAVSATATRQKGDGDAATWLPRPGFRCEYVRRQVEVKAAYDLWVTEAERARMAEVLREDCD